MSSYARTPHLTHVLLFVHLLFVSVTTSTCPTMKEKLTSIHTMVDFAYHKAQILVGMSVGIVADGQIVFTKGYGLRNMTKKDPAPVTNRTLFAIGSCTEAFTSFAVDRLRQDGLLDWNDRIVDHIPEFRLKDPQATSNTRLKDLAAHLSGLPHHDNAWFGSNFSRNELLVRLQQLQPSYAFRERYHHNSIMVAVEGIVVERASNRTWENFVRERILRPLGMTDTYSQVREAWDARVKDIAVGYTVQGTSSIIASFVKVPWLEMSNVAPSLSMVSSAEDMSKWIRAQLQLTGRSTEMHDFHSLIPADDDTKFGALGYGLGWFVGYHQGRKVVFHGGNTVGFVAWVSLFPEEQVGVVLLANTDTRPVVELLQNLSLKIADILIECNSSSEEQNKKWAEKETELGDDKQAALRWSTSSFEKDPEHIREPDQYTGSFVNGGYGVFQVSVNGSGLAASFNGNHKVIRTNVENFFYFSDFLGEFKRNSLGDVVGLYLDLEETVEPIFFAKEVAAYLYDVKYLRPFVGVYGPVTITMVERKVSGKNTLMANSETCAMLYLVNNELAPLKQNWFSQNRRLYFEFVVANKNVTELVLHKGRLFKRFPKE